MSQIKTALICQGGGMRAAFAAGAVAELGENLGVKKFDIVIGVSGSSTTASYYTAGQFSRIRKVWSENLGTTKLVNKKNIFTKKPIFGINYLIDDILRQQFPLDEEAVKNSPTDLFIPFYDFGNKKISYYHNRGRGEAIDIWQAMRASMSMHEEHLAVNNCNVRGVDASIIKPLFLDKAIEEGTTHFLIVSNDEKFKLNFSIRLGFAVFSFFQGRNLPAQVRETLKKYPDFRKKFKREFDEFCQSNKFLLVRPHKNDPIGLLMGDNKKIKQAVDTGRKAIDDCSDDLMMEIFRQRSEQLNNQ